MAFLRNLSKAAGISAAVVLVAGASLAYADFDIDGFNNLTGPRSENRSFYETEKNWDVVVDNQINLDNKYDSFVVTGENEIDENTVVGDILGGDIDVSISAEDGALSGDFGSFSWPDISMGEISVLTGNSITGPNSENINEIFANQDVRLRSRNDLRVDNRVDFNAISGNNRVSENTSVGDFDSGDITVNADLETPRTMLVGGFESVDFGDLGADDIEVDFQNATTGPNSENINRLEANSDVSIDLINDVQIENDLNFDVNSGNNDIFENTVVGDIETGSVRVDVMVD